MKRCKIILALYMAFVIGFLGTNPTTYANSSGGDVYIISSSSRIWGALGQNIEYEMDGNRYESKYAPAHVNLKAWRRMNDRDKREVYYHIFTDSARNATFGSSGKQEIIDWYKTGNTYYKANQLWKQRIAKKSYPELTAKFGPNKSLVSLYPEHAEIFSHQIPTSFEWWDRAQTFKAALAAIEKEYEIGKEYYQQTVDMRTKGIANTVIITITQCTLLLSDMLFLPNVTRGTLNEASGQIADVINFIMDLAKREDNDFNEKFQRYKNGEHGVPFTPEETVKLFGIMMDSYAKMTEKSLQRIDMAMQKLISRYEMLLAAYEYHENQLQLEERMRAEEKAAYEAALQDAFPEEVEEPTGEYKGLNFSWFTAEELANQYGAAMDYTIEERKSEVFYAVLEKKEELDLEVGKAAHTLCSNIIDLYNYITEEIESKEEEFAILETDIEKGCEPSTIDKYISYDWDGDGFGDFNGAFTFDTALYVGGDAVSLYKESWSSLFNNINYGKNALNSLKTRIISFLDSKSQLSVIIEDTMPELISAMDQLNHLKEDYIELRDNVVWLPEGYNENDFINPLKEDEYMVDKIEEIYDEFEWPNEYLLEDIMEEENTSVIKLGYDKPNAIYLEAYNLYEAVIESINYVEERKTISQEYYKNFLADEKAYYNELNVRLKAYLQVQEKMAGKFNEIDNIIKAYERLWEKAYFIGSPDYYSLDYYNVNSTSIPVTAFDTNAIRNYVRGGGNRITLLSSIRELADYASAHEAIVNDLLAQVRMLDIEMGGLWDNRLRDYANNKNIVLKNYYAFKDEYDESINFLKLDNNSYFQLHDINYIVEALSPNNELLETLKDYRRELLGYFSAGSVDKVKVSNRMYDIYTYAERIRELYDGNFFNKTLISEGQRDEILEICRNGTGVGDIMGTLYDILDKHEGTSFNPYSMPSYDDEVDSYNPIGGFDETNLADGQLSITAPLFHPVATNVTSAEANVYKWDDGWKPMGYNEGDGYHLFNNDNPTRVVIDDENDTISIYAPGLKNGENYQIRWLIKYNLGTGEQIEESDQIITIAYEPEVFIKADLKKDSVVGEVITEDSATEALVTISNYTDESIDGCYAVLSAYGDEEELIAVKAVEISNLEPMEIREMEITFDRPVFKVLAHIEDNLPIAPASILIKKEGLPAENIIVKDSGIITYNAEVFDPSGNILYGEDIQWNVEPQNKGVNVDNGIVTIEQDAMGGTYAIIASTENDIYDEVIITLENVELKNSLIFNGLIKNGDLITGGLTFQIINDNLNIDACDFIVSIYDKETNMLVALDKFNRQLTQGLNQIDLDDLSFEVDPGQVYEFKIFSWSETNNLIPIAGIFKDSI